MRDIQEVAGKYFPLVVRIAKGRWRRLPAGIVEQDDLIGEASVRLMECLYKYEAASGTPLSAWIAINVRYRITDYLRELDTIPQDKRQQITLIDKAEIALEQRLHRRPSPAVLDLVRANLLILKAVDPHVHSRGLERHVMDQAKAMAHPRRAVMPRIVGDVPRFFGCLPRRAPRGMRTFFAPEARAPTSSVQGLDMGGMGAVTLVRDEAFEMRMRLAQRGHEAFGGLAFAIILSRDVCVVWEQQSTEDTPSQEQHIVQVRGVCSHLCLRKASAEDTVITGLGGLPGIADPTVCMKWDWTFPSQHEPNQLPYHRALSSSCMTVTSCL
jgi:DNA-directed RNA polymerase specialized sigma24 family protein